MAHSLRRLNDERFEPNSVDKTRISSADEASNAQAEFANYRTIGGGVEKSFGHVFDLAFVGTAIALSLVVGTRSPLGGMAVILVAIALRALVAFGNHVLENTPPC